MKKACTQEATQNDREATAAFLVKTWREAGVAGLLRLYDAELEKRKEPSCLLAGPGRGDCEHAVGLPGKSIPGQHDGDDDTVDHYGKPNGWCWFCWNRRIITTLEALVGKRGDDLVAQEWRR